MELSMKISPGTRRVFHFQQKLPLLSWHRVLVLHHEAISPAEEAMHSFHACFLPVELAIGRSCEKRIHTCGIRAELCDHFIRRNDVPFALRHFCAIFDDHALSEEAGSWLIIAHNAKV